MVDNVYVVSIVPLLFNLVRLSRILASTMRSEPATKVLKPVTSSPHEEDAVRKLGIPDKAALIRKAGIAILSMTNPLRTNWG
jgi:hypothetical protein